MNAQKSIWCRAFFAGVTCLLVAPTSAKVYQRIAFSNQGEALAVRMGLDLGYATKLKVNGLPARMEIFASRDGVSRALDDLRRAEPEGVFFDGEDMAWGFLVDGRDYVRYLLMSAGPGHTATVYRMVVHEKDWLKARGKDHHRHRLTRVPAPDRAEPGFYMADQTTRTEIEVSRSTTGKEQLLRSLHVAFLSKGWTNRSGTATGLGIYTKGHDVLALRIADQNGERIITRIYKRGTPSAD